LIGRCRASDVDCNVGEEFNGGAVEVSGLELLIQYEAQLSHNISLPLSLNYTHTESAFQTRFQSSFSQWGNTVQAGDELPYVPAQVARLNIGLEGISWMLNVGITHTGETRDLPGQGAIPVDELIESRTIVDLSSRYEVTDKLSLGVAVDNLTDSQNIVSLRPFGARPDKPRTVMGTVTYSF